jgi:hypothetical protein
LQSNFASGKIQKAEENIERIPRIITTKATEDIFRKLLRLLESHAYVFSTPDDTRLSLHMTLLISSTIQAAVWQLKTLRHGIPAFYIASPSTPASNSLSLSDLKSFSKEFRPRSLWLILRTIGELEQLDLIADGKSSLQWWCFELFYWLPTIRSLSATSTYVCR